MPEVIVGYEPIHKFWLFERLLQGGTYTPTRRRKYWFDPNPVEALPGLGKAAYRVVATNVENNQPILKNGQPYFTTIYVDLEEARTLNIPPNVANSPGTAEAEWPMPIDMAKWDEHYYLALDTPFSGPVVKDNRAAVVPPASDGFSASDRAELQQLRSDVQQIRLMLTALLESGR